MNFNQLTLDEMLHKVKLREPDDELRVLAEAAEKKVDNAWQDGYDHGCYDGDLNAAAWKVEHK